MTDRPGRADSPSPEGAEPRDQWAQRWADFVERVSNEDRLDTDSRRTLMDYGHAAAIAAEALGRVNGRREAALPEPQPDWWKRIGEWAHDHAAYTKDRPDTVEVMALLAFLDELLTEGAALPEPSLDPATLHEALQGHIDACHASGMCGLQHGHCVSDVFGRLRGTGGAPE